MSSLTDLLKLLDADDGDLVGTSVRVPRNLRDAARLAADLGLADSMTDLAVSNLRYRLEGIAQLAALEETYRQHPRLRPSPAQVALALARSDGSELAEHPDLIEQAARYFADRAATAEPDDLLNYAAGMLAARRQTSAVA